MNWPLAMLLALGLDVLIGWPGGLFARVGHPVTWIGKLIKACDRWLNRDNHSPRLRRLLGCIAAIGIIGVTTGCMVLLNSALPNDLWGTILAGILAWPLVAARSLHDHVAAVQAPLSQGNLDEAKGAVAMIVGRDVSVLNEAGVARAAIESLAENSSDGVVAPLFWGCLLGLPGIAAYKAINTLDSMIGHRTPRYNDFGRASARIDDVVNIVPARLTGLLFALTSLHPIRSIRCMFRDAALHRSPNAGWPESAMAGLLAIRLSGPRAYGDTVADEPWVNGVGRDAGPRDLKNALRAYVRTIVALALLIGLSAWLS